MIVVEAWLEFASEEDRDKAVELTTGPQMATRNEEPGCRAYCFAADPGIPKRIQVYELWDDEASLVAHFKHPNYAAMVEVLRGVGITDTENQLYLTTKQAPVYNPDGSPKEKLFDD